MGVGIAEIDEHPIAHVPGHEAVEPGDRLRDALMIGADYRTQILRVERGRERGRANEVGEHHRQLATLGVVSSSWLDIHECRRCRYGSRDIAEIADRTQHFQPVAERNPKVFEMLVGQVGPGAERSYQCRSRRTSARASGHLLRQPLARQGDNELGECP